MQQEMTYETELEVLAPGTVVAERFRILETLGQGGMGVVYKAEHIHLERAVALKMMLPQHAMSQDIRRFKREAQAASLLDHPNLVRIYDFGIAEGHAYICMDYLEGQNLDQIISQGPLCLDRFKRVFTQACAGLQHAHEKGIIHRDLKPSNLMLVNTDTEEDFVKVLDFGLVKMMETSSEQDHKLTDTNMVLGTPFYMSPEQCRAIKLDHRSDIYSLGCVMYEALTGSPPFSADSLFDIMSMHITENPRPIKESLPGQYVPVGIERVINKAMAKDPNLRIQSMQEFAKGIESAFSGAPEIVISTSTILSTNAATSSKDLRTNSNNPSQLINSKSPERSSKSLKRKGAFPWTTIGLTLSALSLIAVGVMGSFAAQRMFNNTHMSNKISNNSEDSRNRHNNDFGNSEQNKLNSPNNENLKTEDFKTRNLIEIVPKVINKEKMLYAKDELKTKNANIISSNSNSSNNLSIAPEQIATNNSKNQNSISAQFINSESSSNSNSSLDSQSQNAMHTVKISPEQLLNEGNFAFRSSDWATARQKFESALSQGLSSEYKTQLMAKLTLCAYNQQDLRDSQDYFNKFKDLYSFNSRSMENDSSLLYQIYNISKTISDREDLSFSEQILRGSIESSSHKSLRPDRQTLNMQLELSRILLEQGKNSESEQVLQDCINDSNNYPDIQNKAKLHLVQMRVRNNDRFPHGPLGNGGPGPLGGPLGTGPGPFGEHGPLGRDGGGGEGPFGGPGFRPPQQ